MQNYTDFMTYKTTLNMSSVHIYLWNVWPIGTDSCRTSHICMVSATYFSGSEHNQSKFTKTIVGSDWVPHINQAMMFRIVMLVLLMSYLVSKFEYDDWLWIIFKEYISHILNIVLIINKPKGFLSKSMAADLLSTADEVYIYRPLCDNFIIFKYILHRYFD
jgi:hypothetical protein